MKLLFKRLVAIVLIMTSCMQLTAQTQNYLTTSGNKLYDVSGNEVRLTGVNWFGFETSLYSPHGIWTRDMKSVLQQIKDLGFNTIRVPWCNEMLDPGASVTVNSFGTDSYSGISPMNVEESIVTSPIELMDIFVNWCQENDMKIVLDNHSRAADGFLNEAYWYTTKYSEERWIKDWVFIAERYKGLSAVVAMDLNNEPHGSTWGDSDASTDWNKAAERCGNAVLAVNPEVLIIVEGVGEFEGDSYWWGGQLKGAKKYPVVLSNPNKLVYSAHEYGPEVSQQDWFVATDFPKNMPDLWDEHFDYLYESNTSPLFIGEFGIKNQDAFNGIAYGWFTEFMNFMGDKYSWTFWTMNPNSGDTGGILQDDWTSVSQWKLDVIEPHIAPLIPNVIEDELENNAPIANFEGFNEPCGENPRIAFFDASGTSDPDGDTLTYSWNFGDGTTANGISVSHDYSSFNSDIATITLTVSDGELSDSQTNEVSLYVGVCAPSNIDTLEILASAVSGEAPLTITLEGVVTMLYGSKREVNYSWNFDNGNFNSDQSTSVTFNEAGEYVVVLTGEAEENVIETSIIITVVPPIFVGSNLSVNYKNIGNSPADSSINPHFEIVNNGSTKVAYSDLTIRYWFTSEDSNALNFWCDWAQVGTANVLGSFSEAQGMNYLEVSFSDAAGDLLGATSSGNIQNRIAKTNWSNFNENDDYSYDLTKKILTSHEQVTLYQNGNLIWGVEPNNSNQKTLNDQLLTVFPNPTTDMLTISNVLDLKGGVVTITDLSGSEVLSITANTNELTMSVANLKPGLYVLLVITRDNNIQREMISVE